MPISNMIFALPLFGRSMRPSHCPRLFLSCLSESLNSPFLTPLLLGTHSLQTAVLSEFGMCVADPPLSFCSLFSLSHTQTSSVTCAPRHSRTPRRMRTTPGVTWLQQTDGIASKTVDSTALLQCHAFQ